jgi:cellulose synthase/poly-beta-1,6-N-acetylglucosamine synthase-like glycosyltransferase
LEGLLILFVIVTTVQLFYLLFFFRRLIYYQPSPINDLRPVSVVICAKNESSRLEKNIPLLAAQDYPDFEIVVVNDNSEDDTDMVLMRLSAMYPRLVVRNLTQGSNNMKGKKYPLTIGVRAAKHESVLLTDADCMVTGKNWIREMTGLMSDKKEIVLGYAPYRKYENFLNRFVRYEAFMTALQYLSYAIAGVPYMGVGRNMAYQRKLFFGNNIFTRYPHLVSGDDDLLINRVANRKNTAVQIHKDSFIYSEPKKSWEEYWEQKRRHVSTGKYYKTQHQLLLGLFSLTHLLFYPLLVLVLLYTAYPLGALFLFVLRLSIQSIIFFHCMKKLGERDLFRYFPLMDILFLIYYLKLAPDLFKGKRVIWR